MSVTKAALVLLASFTTLTMQLHLDNCHGQLGLQDGSLDDSAFTASSSYDPNNVGPSNARLYNDRQGGAWCPREPVSRENGEQYLEINLGKTHVISEIMTQGRYAKGQGQEYTPAYRLHYWREGLSGFKEYRDSMGKAVLIGNDDTFSVAGNLLNPPLVASKLRVLPYSNHSRTVCLRLGLRGCRFSEGVVAYSIPQGMVRGATLELMDITYDGLEDQITGHLRGGLGQLVDGKYGPSDFKAIGDNGIVKGYEWVGWKNKSLGPLQMDFTFDSVRLFQKMAIHINNHPHRDIQIFSRAKVYFSNEEGKFGDDRAVDFWYSEADNKEKAVNITIDLQEQHGKYVMIHLYFSSKWILISEVTFWSEIYEEKPFTIPPSSPGPDPKLDPDVAPATRTPAVSVDLAGGGSSVEDTKQPAVHSEADHDEDADLGEHSRYVGLIIGLLLTVITLLLAGIVFVMYRGRQGKETPSHSLLTTKIQDKIAAGIDFKDMTSSYTPYKAKMRVYGHVPSHEEDDGNLYATPVLSTTGHIYTAATPAGFHNSLNKKFTSDPVLSEDCTDDYAEPQLVSMGRHPHNSASFSDNIYAHAFPVANGGYNPRQFHAGGSGGGGQYAKPGGGAAGPLEANRVYSSPDSRPFVQFTQSRRACQSLRSSPPKTLNIGGQVHASTSAVPTSGRKRSRAHSASQLEMARSPIGLSPAQSSLSSMDRFYGREERIYAPTVAQEFAQQVYSKVKKSPETVPVQLNARQTSDSGTDGDDSKNFPEVPMKEPAAVSRSQLKILERVGRGQYGDVHLCHYLENPSRSALVAVKSLDTSNSPALRLSFETEASILSAITDENIARVIGANLTSEPFYMVCEYSDEGDLNQFLQEHVAESALSRTPSTPTLSYGALIYMATQIAAGMKYLESINFIHRDLATRNCLVLNKYRIKISDCGSVKSCYDSDYYLSPAGARIPLRWMAWESIIMGKYTTKSDVWSYGVTLWEILTFAREQPFESLGEAEVLENISNIYQKGQLLHTLPQPYNCPRDIFDLITECFHKMETERPSFREIHLFLQRKNLGFKPEDEIR